jgi:hypothetical protein
MDAYAQLLNDADGWFHYMHMLVFVLVSYVGFCVGFILAGRRVGGH